ncbi:hypothetical protein Taro_024969 [Colocasia esculenta]|uniref:Uncharacterized protein n=1 Tax=Colocasia esculenta TaxID=4460 RepID=A0A843VJ40_COLES|nr:hypothetical protein [Colocasia esculenta]
MHEGDDIGRCDLHLHMLVLFRLYTTLLNASTVYDADFKTYPRPGLHGTNIYCKGSVDTPHTGVDTMLQSLSQKMKKWSTSIDIRPG